MTATKESLPSLEAPSVMLELLRSLLLDPETDNTKPWEKASAGTLEICKSELKSSIIIDSFSQMIIIMFYLCNCLVTQYTHQHDKL